MKTKSQEMFRRWVRQARARYMMNGGWFGTARFEEASGARPSASAEDSAGAKLTRGGSRP